MQKHECTRAQIKGTSRVNLAKRHMDNAKDEAVPMRWEKAATWTTFDYSIQLEELPVEDDHITVEQYKTIITGIQIHQKLLR